MLDAADDNHQNAKFDSSPAMQKMRSQNANTSTTDKADDTGRGGNANSGTNANGNGVQDYGFAHYSENSNS